ncbi:MAG: hypothetical protein ACOVNL_01610 [Prochlorococcaceae cyanobacterium]
MTRSSWLQQSVPLGPFTMPGGMVLYVLLCAGVVAALNLLYLRPDVGGIGYSKGYRRIRPLEELAPRLRELQDPELERQVRSFLRFDRRFRVAATVAIAALLSAGLLLGLLLPPA